MKTKINVKKKILIIFIVLFILACFVAMSVASFFSSSLSIIGEVTPQGTIGALETNFYLVCPAKSQLEREAEILAKDTPDSSGYIWKNGEYYYVVYGAYENKNDATLVIKQLEKQQTNCELLEIYFNQILIDEDFSVDQRNLLVSTYSMFLTSFRLLSDLAIGQQTAVYSTAYSQEKLDGLIEKLEKNADLFESAFTNNSSYKINETIEYFSDLIETVCMTKPEIQDLKYNSIEILEIYKNLCEDLK